MSYGMTITVFPTDHANGFKLHIDKSTWDEHRCVKSENIASYSVTTETKIPEDADNNLWMITVTEYIYSVLVGVVTGRRDGVGYTNANGRQYFAEATPSLD